MKKVIVIRGPLGVGKSTIAKIIAKNLNAKYLSLDKIIDDNDLVGINGIPVENFLISNEIIFDLINKNNKNYIIDGCYYYQEQIDDLKEKFKGNIMFFTLTCSLQKCIERDSKREKVYGKSSAEFVYNVTAKIKEGYEIDNSKLSIKQTVDKIMEKIKY